MANKPQAVGVTTRISGRCGSTPTFCFWRLPGQCFSNLYFFLPPICHPLFAVTRRCILPHTYHLHFHSSPWPSIMFSVDLSWTEASAEKVGERRERIARERSTPSATPSIKSTISSSTSIKSITKDKVLFWTSNVKKAKSLKPIKSARSDRPGTSRSTATSHSRKTSNSSPRHIEIDVSHHWRDPALQPAWTYTSSLSPNLPSGQPIESPAYEVPELEGDGSSRGIKSQGAPSPCKPCIGDIGRIC